MSKKSIDEKLDKIAIDDESGWPESAKKRQKQRNKQQRPASELKRGLYGLMRLRKLYRFKKWYNYFTDEETVLKRKSDGTLWIASHNGYANSMTSLFSDSIDYYFRRCKPFKKGYIIDWNQV